MPLETPTNGIEDLNPSWPLGSDPKSQGDDHLRNTKAALQLSFPNTAGAWNTTDQIKAGGFDASGSKVVNVADPTEDQDAATKIYVDAADQELKDRLDDLEAVDPPTVISSWGNVESDGTISGGSNDFTVQHLNVGWFRLVFNATALGQKEQACTATAQGGGTLGDLDLCHNQFVDANTVDIFIRNLDGTVDSTDSGFSFLRVARVAA